MAEHKNHRGRRRRPISPGDRQEVEYLLIDSLTATHPADELLAEEGLRQLAESADSGVSGGYIRSTRERITQRLGITEKRSTRATLPAEMQAEGDNVAT